jgi:hypothetical protein
VLAHIWPTHHENIHFYGTHSVDVAGELAKLGPPVKQATRPPATWGNGVSCAVASGQADATGP